MATYVDISKEVEWDSAHRVPMHASKCRHVHGHRYKLRTVCKGTIVEEKGAPDEGMLIDFGYLKKFMMSAIHDVLDHKCIIYEKDRVFVSALENSFYESIVLFPYIPTAENIARWCWESLEPLIQGHFRDNLELRECIVWETPTSIAYYRGEGRSE